MEHYTIVRKAAELTFLATKCGAVHGLAHGLENKTYRIFD